MTAPAKLMVPLQVCAISSCVLVKIEMLLQNILYHSINSRIQGESRMVIQTKNIWTTWSALFFEIARVSVCVDR